MTSDDTYKLTIIFSGLCGFVPRGESEEDLERMDVLLVKVPNLPEDLAPRSRYGSYDSVEHQPILRFALKNLLADNRIKGDADGYWYLDGEDVSLALLDDDEKELPLTGSVKMKTKVRIPGSERPIESLDWVHSVEEQETDISWLPEVEKAYPDAAAVSPDLLDGEDPSPTVAARFRFHSGLLRSDKIARFNDDYVVAQFVPPYDQNQPYAQAIAHWVALDIQLERRFSLLFKAVKYRDASQERTLVLRPAGTDPEIVVYISNLCCGNYARQAKGSGAAAVEMPGPDLDFEHLYELSDHFELAANGEIWPVPVPTKFPQNAWRLPQAGGSTGIKCTGGRFSVTPLGEGGDR